MVTGDFRRNAVFLSFGLLPTKKRQMAGKRGAKGVVECVCVPLTACGRYAQTTRRAGEVGS